jgi:hypothetical protein
MSRAVVVVTSLLALLLLGCGGDEELSKEEYESRVVEFSETLREALEPVGADLSGASDLKLIATRLDDGAEVLEGAADDFADVEPPGDVRAAHDKLVRGVRAIARTFRTGADQAAEGDRARLFDTLSRYAESDGPRQIAEAQEEFRRLGYRGSS